MTRTRRAALRVAVAALLAVMMLLTAQPARADAPAGMDCLGGGILWMQQALAGLGYDVESTGLPDGATEAALEAFARDNGLGEKFMASSASWDTLLTCLMERYSEYLDTLSGSDGQRAQYFSAENAAREEYDRWSGGRVRGLSAGELVAAYAQTFIGVPYRWGHADPDVGFDCSGLVWYVYRHFGQKVPRDTRGMSQVGQPVASLREARPGDILCFGRPVRHVGLYIGDNKMIHAPQRNTRVVVVELDRTPSYIRRIYN